MSDFDMKIGLVAKPWIPVPSQGYGAIEKLVYYLINQWSQTVSVTLFAPGDSRILESERLQLNSLFEISVGDFIFDNNIELAQALHAAHEGLAANLNLFNVHSVDGFMVIAPFLSIPTVFSVHTMPNPIFESISRLSSRTHFVFLTKSHQQQFPWISQSEIIPPGIDVSSFPFQEEKSDYLVFIGQLIPEKGCVEAIEIAQQAGLPLKIAGIIPLGSQDFFKNILKPFMDRYEHVEFLGEILDSERNTLLKSARALLFPIKWDEPLGLVMIEALAVGTPVIGFNRGSVGEVVEHGISGFVVETVEEAVQAIAQCHHLSSKACRERVENKFNVCRTAELYLDVFKRIIEKW